MVCLLIADMVDAECARFYRKNSSRPLLPRHNYSGTLLCKKKFVVGLYIFYRVRHIYFLQIFRDDNIILLCYHKSSVAYKNILKAAASAR